MKKVMIEDISLELFKISKKLILLADVASPMVEQQKVESLLELRDDARSMGDDLLGL
jgi:hypothetical protein